MKCLKYLLENSLITISNGVRFWTVMNPNKQMQVPEMAQKVIEGDVDTWKYMHEILIWPEIWTIQFLFCLEISITCQNPEMGHFFSPKTLRWPRIRREMDYEAKMVRILGHLKIFGLKKVAHLRILTRDWYFERKLKRNWMVRILGHLRISCICFHVSTSPSMTFWAISGTLPVSTLIGKSWKTHPDFYS